LYILIGIVVAFLALSAAVALPSNAGFRNERPRYRRVPGDANSAQNIVGKDAALALDGVYMPIPR
jgi:hypothetical protein